MLKAYFDDSDMGQGPVAVLAGWMATAAQWEAFSDDWDKVLRMSPRIEYFKWRDACGPGGQFSGITPERRDEKVRLLVDVLERHNPRGIACAMPNDLHRIVFGGNPDKIMRNPYFLLFCSVTSQLIHFVEKEPIGEKIDFIFDIQPGQMAAAFAAWEYMREIVPPELKNVIGRLNFEDDTKLIPLQAADMSAGWTREQAEGIYSGIEPRVAPWGDRGRNLRCLIKYWTPELLKEFSERCKAQND